MEAAERRPARPRLIPAPPLSDDEMRAAWRPPDATASSANSGLDRSGIAGTFDPATVKPSIPVAREGERIGLILDTEIAGLDHGSHEIIELGMVAFTYGEAGIRDVVGTV